MYIIYLFNIAVSSSNYKELKATIKKELDRMCKEAVIA
jgi:hypothetical protein